MPNPVITSQVPGEQPVNTWRTVTIRGTDLDQVTNVRMHKAGSSDTYPLSNFVKTDATQISVRTISYPVEWTFYFEFELGPNSWLLPGGPLFYVRGTYVPPPELDKRNAWLILNGERLSLDDIDAGYAMTELDLSYPEVRDVVNNRPVQHGIDDQTRYFGGRAVTASITAVPSGKVPLDDIVRLFGPYMNPAVRPELHYTLISGEMRERVITLRPSGMSAPMPSPGKREFQLAWIAPDPVIKDAEVRAASAWAGTPTHPGRTYDLVYDPDGRHYPPGSGQATHAYLETDGDIPVPPRLLVYGPITGPSIELDSYVSGSNEGQYRGMIIFLPSFTIGTGEWVDIDTRTRRAFRNSDPEDPVTDQINFGSLTWPLIFPKPYLNTLYIYGSSTDHISQVQAQWQDLYLS